MPEEPTECPICGDSYHLIEVKTTNAELRIPGRHCLEVVPDPTPDTPLNEPGVRIFYHSPSDTG